VPVPVLQNLELEQEYFQTSHHLALEQDYFQTDYHLALVQEYFQTNHRLVLVPQSLQELVLWHQTNHQALVQEPQISCRLEPVYSQKNHQELELVYFQISHQVLVQAVAWDWQLCKWGRPLVQRSLQRIWTMPNLQLPRKSKEDA